MFGLCTQCPSRKYGRKLLSGALVAGREIGEVSPLGTLFQGSLPAGRLNEQREACRGAKRYPPIVSTLRRKEILPGYSLNAGRENNLLWQHTVP